MEWRKIENHQDLETLDKLSHSEPVLLYKHSTRCSISTAALSRIERRWKDPGPPAYYLDLLAHRQLSDEITARYGVRHESPQLLCIVNSKCVKHQSHMEVDAQTIMLDL